MDYYSLGSIYLMRGDFDRSIKSFSHIVELHKRGKVRQDLAGLTHVYMCIARRLRNDLDLAEENIVYSLKLLEKTGETQYLAEAQLEHAELMLAQNNPNGAKEISLDVLNRATNSGAKPIQSKVYRILANADDALGEFDSPLELIQKSILITQEVGIQNDEAYSIIAKTRFCLKRNIVDFEIKQELIHAINILKQTGAKLDLEEAESLLKQVNRALEAK